MTDCKHEHLVHCPICDTVRCADCGKTWIFEQDRETAPVMWPHYEPYPWPGIIGSAGGTLPPVAESITITCG